MWFGMYWGVLGLGFFVVAVFVGLFGFGFCFGFSQGTFNPLL